MKIFSPFFCLAVFSFAAGLFADETKRPNIVVILADDIGYGDVSCYGAKSVQTPNVDRLAAGGIRFTDGHAVAASCTPTRYALITGQYPWRKPGTNVLPGDAALIIPPGSTTLPSMLKNAGYATAVVGKWHLGLGTPEEGIDWNRKISPGPLEIGFDYSFIIPATGDRTPCVYVENHHVYGLDPNDPITVNYKEKVGDDPTGKERPDLLKMGLHHGHDQTIVNGISRIGYMSGGKSARWIDEDMADVITAKACRFIENNKDKPFFLYFATHDIHVPRVPHPRFVGKTSMGPRGDAVVSFDWSVGEILNTLDRHGLTENTLVVLSSDNGPVLNDGYLDQAVELLGDHKPAGPLRGGKTSAFEAGTRVPFIVHWPQEVKPGVSGALVSSMDLAASFAALTGQTVEPAAFPDSENVLPALLGKSRSGREYFVRAGGPMSLRHGFWKMIVPRQGAAISQTTHVENGNSPIPQLYRLDTDLGERDNLAEIEPGRYEQMLAKYQEIRGSASPAVSGFKPVVVDKPECRLSMTFADDAGTRITDSSGKDNHGTLRLGPLEKADGGGKRFNGKSFIDIGKSPSLAFARTPWTVAVVFNAESPDGVLISVGANAQGFSLALEKGRPVFTATINSEEYRLVSPKVVEGPSKLTAMFTAESKMVLYIRNEKVAERALPTLVPTEPAAAWRIGALSSGNPSDSSFVGILSSVTMFVGEVPPTAK